MKTRSAAALWNADAIKTQFTIAFRTGKVSSTGNAQCAPSCVHPTRSFSALWNSATSPVAA